MDERFLLLQDVLDALASGPKSSTELPVTDHQLREMKEAGLIAIDPDRFPGEYVPGNPLIARLPSDERTWPGWSRWNV